MHTVYNKHAQNYTKYAQNSAFTNGTPNRDDKISHQLLGAQ